MNYEDVIARKTASAPPAGFVVDDSTLARYLFQHQRDLVRWALRRGRAAIFADTGLGKTAIFLEWARMIASDHGRVLVLAPLAVGTQHEGEAAKFNVPGVKYLRADDGETEIVVTNYEMLRHFDPSEFAGVVLDESSILKAFEGKTKARLIEAFAETPFRLCCTATPAPNDFTELGNHSEFLGLKTRAEMLAEYFVHDGGSTQDWRIKGHAIEPFWRWVATWGAVVKLPSDLGYDDGAYALPRLVVQDRVVASTDAQRAEAGVVGAEARTLTEQRRARRATIAGRVATVAELVATYADQGEQSVVWCELNDEQDELADMLGDACVSIAGSDDDEDKVELHQKWKRGETWCLVSKPSIFGYGLNWQHCHRVIFVGASHSYERTYQAVRRCWRFGQTSEVTVDMVRADLEGAVADNYKRKEVDDKRMADAMRLLVGDAIRAEVRGLAREFNPYAPDRQMIIPSWMYEQDGIDVRCEDQ